MIVRTLDEASERSRWGVHAWGAQSADGASARRMARPEGAWRICRVKSFTVDRSVCQELMADPCNITMSIRLPPKASQPQKPVRTHAGAAPA